MTTSTNLPVVVTGGNGRLGATLLRDLARNGLTAISIVRPGRATRDAGSTYEADLADDLSVEACFRSITSDHGTIGALIHAAGGWASTPLLTTPLAVWEELVRTNLLTTYVCFRAAAQRMQEGGRLIAFAAAQGADRGFGGQSAYSVAKGGIVRLVESIGAELVDTGITAHAIAPSTILYEGDPATGGVAAADLVALCLHLLSPAGAALNGQVLRAYGRR